MQSKNIPRDKDKTKNTMIWYHEWVEYNKENAHLEKRHILWVFWDNKHITKLCEKWIYCDGNYAYTRFEKIRTYSGEVFFTNAHKGTLSKEKSNTDINIDELKMFRYLYSEETILKTKKECKGMLDKINNKISKINCVNKMLEKIRTKIELIYQSMFKLHDDPWLRLADLNKIDAIIDDEINFIWYRLFKNNRISSNKINIDKHKDTDGYVNKLTNVMRKKMDLLEGMYDSINNIIIEIKNKTNMIYKKMHKVTES